MSRSFDRYKSATALLSPGLERGINVPHGRKCKCMLCVESRISNGTKQPRERSPRHTGRVAGAVTGAVFSGALTLGQVIAEPQQNDTNTQGNWADSSMETQETDSARTQRGATRDKGNRTGGTSRRK